MSLLALETSNYTAYAFIELTSRCNLRCVYCALSHPEYHGEDFDFTRLDSVIEDLKERKTRFLLMSGHGESTIIKDWHLLCNRLIDEGFQLMLNTNLSKTLSEEEIETLTRFHIINTSFDTVDAELFSKLRRYSKIETVWENMDRIQNASRMHGYSPYWAWNAVVSDVTVFQLRDWAAEGLRRGVGTFNMFTLGNYRPQPDMFMARPLSFLSNDEAYRAHQKIKEVQGVIQKAGAYLYIQPSIIESLTRNGLKEKSVRSSMKNSVKQNDQKMTRDCFDPWFTAIVKSDGGVAPCCVQAPLGQLDENHSLNDVLANESFTLFRKQLVNGEMPSACQNCTRRSKISRKKFKWKLRLYKAGSFVVLHFFWFFKNNSPKWIARMSQRTFIFLQKL